MSDHNHDCPPHCRPRPNGETCCVGVLRARCRKCGQDVWTNSPCTIVESPWTDEQWDANWDQYGNGRGYYR